MALKSEKVGTALKDSILWELDLCVNDTNKIRTMAELLLGLEVEHIFVIGDENKMQALKEIFDDIAFSIENRLNRVEKIFKTQYWEVQHG